MKRLSRRNRRSSILDAARKTLAKRGFHGTRALDVAQEARVSPGLLFRYFPTMRNLQHAVMARGQKRPPVPWPRGLSKAPLRTALESIATLFLTTFERDPDLLRLMLFGALTGAPASGTSLRREILRTVRRVTRFARAWRDRGWIRESVDPGALSWLVTSLLLQFVMARDLLGIRTGTQAFDGPVEALIALVENRSGADERDRSGVRSLQDGETRPPARDGGRALSSGPGKGYEIDVSPA